MLSQVREEATEVGCYKNRGMDGERLIGIWDDDDGGNFIQVLGTHYVDHQKQLARGGSESSTGAGKVGTNGKDLVERRGG